MRSKSLTVFLCYAAGKSGGECLLMQPRTGRGRGEGGAGGPEVSQTKNSQSGNQYYTEGKDTSRLPQKALKCIENY